MEKKRALGLMLLPFLSLACLGAALAAETPQDVKGLNWLQLSIGDRRQQVYVSMAILEKNQIHLQGDLYFYYNALLERIEHDPAQYQRRLSWILADYVYENEPSTRKVINSLRRTTA